MEKPLIDTLFPGMDQNRCHFSGWNNPFRLLSHREIFNTTTYVSFSVGTIRAGYSMHRYS